MKLLHKIKPAYVLGLSLLVAMKSPFTTASTDIDLIDSIQSSQVIELNFVWDANSPLLNMNPPFTLAMVETHKETTGMLPDMTFAADIMYFSGQHGAPTIDAIGHIGHKGELYGGVDAIKNDGSRGLKSRGIEEYPTNRLINRAVLLDVARYKSVDYLDAGYEITVEDLQGTAKLQGVDIQPGDSVLIRTGYGQFFESNKAKYMGARPGPGAEAARWLAKKQIFLGGSDQLSFEVVPKEGSIFPVHKIFLAENGIYIVENLNLEALGDKLAKSNKYEFLLVLNPPRVRGASGMALNAFAIVP